MQTPLKLHFLDTETTGVSHRHVIIQIAGIIDIGYGCTCETYNMTMAPSDTDPVSVEALAVNGRTLEEIKNFEHKRHVHIKYKSMMAKHVNPYDKSDKFFMIGYNVGFDQAKMMQWFKACDDDFMMSWFHFPVIDVAVLAGIKLINHRQRIKKFNLMTAAKELGVITVDGEEVTRTINGEVMTLHDAMADTIITRDMFYMLTKDMAVFNGGENA